MTDYSRAPNYLSTADGKRYATDKAPNPTVITPDDVNQLIWSLVEVIKDAGLTPKQFSLTDPSTYQDIRDSLRAKYLTINNAANTYVRLDQMDAQSSDQELNAAMAVHVGTSNPHPQYLTNINVPLATMLAALCRTNLLSLRTGNLV